MNIMVCNYNSYYNSKKTFVDPAVGNFETSAIILHSTGNKTDWILTCNEQTAIAFQSFTQFVNVSNHYKPFQFNPANLTLQWAADRE